MHVVIPAERPVSEALSALRREAPRLHSEIAMAITRKRVRDGCVHRRGGRNVACVPGGRETTDSHAADLAEIEKLRRLDVTATLSGDWTALSEAWADDVVILQEGHEPEVGKQAILAQRRMAKPGFRVVSYVPVKA